MCLSHGGPRPIHARKLHAILSENFSERKSEGDINICLCDALAFDYRGFGEKIGKKYKVIANLPYNISTEMLFTLIDNHRFISRAVLMLQKEVAERLVAKPGTKEYGVITVLTSLMCDVRIGLHVGRGCFYPAPKVDSAVVIIDFKEKLQKNIGDEKLFKSVVRAAFGKRRKTLKNCLLSLRGIDAPEDLVALEKRSGIDLTRRGETLSVDEFATLSNAILDIQKR